VAYVNKIGPGQTRIELKISMDGGMTWSAAPAFATSTLSGLPSLAITASGVIGLMYTDFVGGRLQTHLVQSADNFASFSDQVFFSFMNGNPPGGGVYIGDFQEILAEGDTFYGVFSAGNNLNNVQTPFGGLEDFQRFHAGDPQAGTFVLRNATGGNVPFSIDPYFFTVAAIPEPSAFFLLALGALGLLGYAWRRR
jgi:hypothetical protein